MSNAETEMASLDERDHDVLRAMQGGRANPLLVRERTALDKGDVNTVLVRLARSGYVEQITRGLYEITEKGHKELRKLRAERELWVFHDPVTESDLTDFPEKTKEMEQDENYRWLLLGVTDNSRAFYFDKVDQMVFEVESDGGELVELSSQSIQSITHGDTFADRIMNYTLRVKDGQEWARWSRYSLALSFAEGMESVAHHILTNQERIGYAFRVVFDIPSLDAMPFLGLDEATTDEFSRSALSKMEDGERLREWLDNYGLPREQDEWK